MNKNPWVYLHTLPKSRIFVQKNGFQKPVFLAVVRWAAFLPLFLRRELFLGGLALAPPLQVEKKAKFTVLRTLAQLVTQPIPDSSA